MSSGSFSEVLGEFVAGVRFHDLPAAVVEEAKCRVLDTVGVALAGVKRSKLGQAVFSMMSRARPEGGATIIGTWQAVPARDAALANGILAHSLDWDDGHRYAASHLGAVVVPAALAVAEEAGASGRDVLTSIVVGYELFARVASSINPGHFLKGFHTTGTCGVFGSAAAAAKVAGLSGKQTSAALGIAGLQGMGLLEVLNSGQCMKPLHAGRASAAGVFAAELAAMGLDGPEEILEGEKGFLRAMAEGCDKAILLDGLGENYEILRCYTKPYPCCRHMHAPIDLVLALREEHLVPPDAIEEIRVYTYSVAISETGRIYVPTTLEAALFSMPHAVAVAAVHGRVGPDELEKGLNDPAVQRIRKKVRITLDPQMDRLYPHERGARLVVKMSGGGTLSRSTPLARGEPELPLTGEEITEKFLHCARAVIASDVAARIRDVIFELDAVDSFKGFAGLVGANGS